MKLRFSFLLCSVLIYGCLSVTAAPAPVKASGDISERDMADMHDCLGQYLKRKGKLSQDEQTGNNWSKCYIFTDTLVRKIRENFENKTKEHLPNELDCVMREFEKNEITDFFMKVVYHQTGQNYKSLSATEKETLLDDFANEGQTLKMTIATACGFEEGKLDTFLLSAFVPRSKKGKAPVDTVTTSDNA